jgi:SpoVK/Ycf46/Vps4 family AAA+-type ATPase
MHHEDRAGVDALLAGVDSLAGEGVSVVVMLRTNRERALDPAILRRTAATFQFGRPDDEQRRAVLTEALSGTGISNATLTALVAATGPTDRHASFTYSDLTQRLIPAAILAAFPDKPLTDDMLVAVARDLQPTPEFREIGT